MHGGEEYAYGMWVVAAFNIGIFLFFLLSFLKPRGSDEWRSMGVVTAFRWHLCLCATSTVHRAFSGDYRLSYPVANLHYGIDGSVAIIPETSVGSACRV
jgi:hypothetical protein